MSGGSRIERVLVANRGEIAVRVIRALQDSGRHAIALHSEPDASALHVRIADAAVPLDGSSARESYLDQDQVLAAARRSGAEAIHPGYGFLSESADFAEAVVAAGMTWIGPPVAAMRAMSDKVSSRRTAEAAGVTPVPGSGGEVTDAAALKAFGDQHGWPLAIKASYGGGGRGIRIVDVDDDLGLALETARSEAQRSFGRGECYVERFIRDARHVEVQVLADWAGRVAAVGDRDCSSQRRHQKLVEEAPSPGLSADTRRCMHAAAVAVASTCGYVGAGTVEFLVSGTDFWFLEMNTRLQVEHPVTELVTHADLVAAQMSVAEGRPLGMWSGTADGHAIECRINAERVVRGRYLPSAGMITRLEVPTGPWVRFDTGYASGDAVSPHYDSLIGKLVVWAPDRPTAVRRMQRALRELVIEGVHTNVESQLDLVTAAPFVEGRTTTQWVEQHLAAIQTSRPPSRAGHEQ